MAENADVQYTIRADSSHLETDLNQAENLVRQSAERTEQALDNIAEAAENSGERAAEAVENVAQSAQETTESLNDVAEAAADTADNIGNAAQQAEQAFSDISEAAEQTGESAAGAAENVGSSAEATAEALDGIAEAAQRAGESAAGAGDELGRSTEEAGKSSEETRKKYMTLGEELDAVNKLLEKDSKNTALCAQKKELLKKAIAETSDKLKSLKDRQAEMNRAYKNGDIPAEEYREFQREVAAAEQELQSYRDELSKVGKASEETGEKTESKLSGAFSKIGTAIGAATAAVAAGAAAIGAAAVKALGDISDSAYDCAGAVDEIVEVNYSSLSDALGGLQRQVELLIQPLGDTLIPVIKEVVDRLSGMADEVIPELVAAIQPVIDKLVPLIEPLMELIASVLPQLVELVTPIISMVSELVQTVLPPLTEFLEGELLPVIMDMFKWLEEKLFPVVQEIIAKLLPPLLDIVSSLLPLIEVALDLLEPVLDIVMALIDPLAAILQGLSPIVSILADLVRTILEPIRQQLSNISDGLNDSSSILTEVFGRALKIVSELLGDTLLPALEGVAQFLSGDFIGAAETWGEGFESTVRNVCEHIDEIFGTHIAEWYDKFNNFFMNIGSRLYEATHGDEIELQELGRKYSTMRDDLNDAIKAAIYGGASVDEAVKKAKAQVLDSSEKVYYYDKVSADWNLDEAAQQYYDGKDLPEPAKTFHIDSGGTAGSWRNAEYARQAGYTVHGTKYNSTPWQNAEYAEKADAGADTPSAAEIEPVTFKPYTPADDDKTKKSGTADSGKASTKSGGGNIISITSYVPTMWDNDQTAALKSLIGRDVLGKTTSAHQINALTGAISGAAESASASKETDLADVINAITKLQRKVEGFESAFGDMTIELTADDLTIGKACVRDCNIMAKRSGKSPFNF